MDAAFKPIGYLVSAKSKRGTTWHSRFFVSGHEAFHAHKQWQEQFGCMAKEGGTFHLERVYEATSPEGAAEAVKGGTFEVVAYRVSIRGAMLLRTKLCCGSHEAFHILKQWKDQFSGMVERGCTLHSDLVYVAVPAASPLQQGDER